MTLNRTGDTKLRTKKHDSTSLHLDFNMQIDYFT